MWKKKNKPEEKVKTRRLKEKGEVPGTLLPKRRKKVIEPNCWESKSLLDKSWRKGKKIREKHTREDHRTDADVEEQEGQVGACYCTCLAELRSALALARHAHHGLHFGTNAGAPLLVVSAYCADRRVWLAAVRLLQVTHVAADACALGHVHPAGGAHLPVFHFGCKVTVSHRHCRGQKGEEGGPEERMGGGGKMRGDKERVQAQEFMTYSTAQFKSKCPSALFSSLNLGITGFLGQFLLWEELFLLISM